MSHILDALQKVQEQKVAKLKHLTITGGSLIDSSVRRKSYKKWYMIGAVIVLLSVAASGTWHFLKQPKNTTKTETKEQVYLPQPQIQTTVTPVKVKSAVPASTSAQSVPLPVSNRQKSTNVRSEEKAQAIQKTVSSSPTKKHKAMIQTSSATKIISSPPEGIKLTGIAWQEDRKLRRAVVNDILIGEKDEIAGAKTIEIRPDMVRFEKNGLYYDVVLPR